MFPRVRFIASRSTSKFPSPVNRRCPWNVLGLKRDANIDDCKEAFRKLALSLHPDVNQRQDASARFAEVVEAYRIITGCDADTHRGSSFRDNVVMAVDGLKRDENYAVFTVCVRLDQLGGGIDPAASSAACSCRSKYGDDQAALIETQAVTLRANSEHVHEVIVSPWDSVADVRAMVQEVLQIPPNVRLISSRTRGLEHALIYKGQVMAEHLLVADYELSNGDILHFAMVRLR